MVIFASLRDSILIILLPIQIVVCRDGSRDLIKVYTRIALQGEDVPSPARREFLDKLAGLSTLHSLSVRVG